MLLTSLNSRLKFSNRSFLLATNITLNPCSANRRVKISPIPDDAPVISAYPGFSQPIKFSFWFTFLTSFLISLILYFHNYLNKNGKTQKAKIIRIITIKSSKKRISSFNFLILSSFLTISFNSFFILTSFMMISQI